MKLKPTRYTGCSSQANGTGAYMVAALDDRNAATVLRSHVRRMRKHMIRLGLFAIVANEIRGIVTVVMASPLWWPIMKAMLAG